MGKPSPLPPDGFAGVWGGGFQWLKVFLGVDRGFDVFFFCKRNGQRKVSLVAGVIGFLTMEVEGRNDSGGVCGWVAADSKPKLLQPMSEIESQTHTIPFISPLAHHAAPTRTTSSATTFFQSHNFHHLLSQNTLPNR